MKNTKIGFLGAGNMASAFLRGLLKSGHSPEALIASDIDASKLSAMRSEFGIQTTPDNETLVRGSDILILAVKPQGLQPILSTLAPIFAIHAPLTISIVTGVPIQTLQAWAGRPLPVVRAMPNTPASIGEGMSVLVAPNSLASDDRAKAEYLFSAIGRFAWVDKEALIDVVTGVSGSGPAYFFLFFEALQQAAIKHGIPEHLALELVLQTALGAALYAKNSTVSLATLRAQVTAPGGTTERGLNVLFKHDFETLIEKTVAAAVTRARELSTPLSPSG